LLGLWACRCHQVQRMRHHLDGLLHSYAWIHVAIDPFPICIVTISTKFMREMRIPREPHHAKRNSCARRAGVTTSVVTEIALKGVHRMLAHDWQDGRTSILTKKLEVHRQTPTKNCLILKN
jgi:hypothetical protein